MDEPETFNSDFLLEQLGGCGRFQVILVIIIHVTFIPGYFSYFLMTFGLYNPGWRCLDNVTLTSNDWSSQNISFITRFKDDNTTQLPEFQAETCQGFDTCQHIEFSPEASTIVTEWGLTCSKGWIISTLLSIEMVGNALSSVSIGYLGDRFGRKWPFIISNIVIVVLSLVSMFSVSWEMYAVTIFLLGLTGSFRTLANILETEYVTPNWRIRINSIPTYSIMSILAAVSAMLTKSWKSLRLISVISGVVCIIPQFWLPESMRWLSVRGNKEKSLEMATKLAKTNKADLPNEDQINRLIEKNSNENRSDIKTYTFVHLFRRGYRLTTIIIAAVIFSCDLNWYVFNFGVAALPGDMFTNLIIFSVCSLPSGLISFTVASRFNRKPTMFISYLLSCLCLFGVVALDLIATGKVRDFGILASILAVDFFLTIGWIVLMTSILELYPTVVRSTANSFFILISDLSGVVAPYLIPTDPSTFYINYLIMAILLLLAAASIIFLPETKGIPLYDTWEETQQIDENPNTDKSINRAV